MYRYRLSQKAKMLIAKNLVDFMVDASPLLPETINFIYNWVRRPNGTGAAKGFYDVWDVVLRHYLPSERPVLFRSCMRISTRGIQSFTGKIYAAYRFSAGCKGHLLVCDTKEYLQLETKDDEIHKLSFFPLAKCVEKIARYSSSCLPKSFYRDCALEDEYIVRVSYSKLYDLKWAN